MDEREQARERRGNLLGQWFMLLAGALVLLLLLQASGILGVIKLLSGVALLLALWAAPSVMQAVVILVGLVLFGC